MIRMAALSTNIYSVSISGYCGAISCATWRQSPRGGQHVGFIDHSYFLTALTGIFVGQMKDAFHFFTGIYTGVISRVAVFAASLWTTEVQTTCEFTYIHEIGIFYQFGTKAVICDLMTGMLLPDGLLAYNPSVLRMRSNPCSGRTFAFGSLSYLGEPDGSEKNSIGLHAEFVRCCRIRISGFVNGRRHPQGRSCIPVYDQIYRTRFELHPALVLQFPSDTITRKNSYF